MSEVASNELDETIAEKVLGKVRGQDFGIRAEHGPWEIGEDFGNTYCDRCLTDWRDRDTEPCVKPVVNYSSSMTFAWGIAERLGLSVLRHPESDEYTAGRITEVHPEMFSVSVYLEHQVTAATAPLAICLAALAAVAPAPPEEETP